MKRVNIIGTTGSGKSTFALQLSQKLGYPCVQLDQLFWKPNWQETPDDELIGKLTQALSGEFWILDGNYNRTNDIKWSRADTIIWLDFGFVRNLSQLLKRTLMRAITRQELWPGTGNRESISRSFLSKDSILIWFFLQHPKNRSRYSRIMQSKNHRHIEMIRLTNPGAVKKFLRNAPNRLQADQQAISGTL